MIVALTPQERQDLNAWLAEHVYHLPQSEWEIPCEVKQHTISNSGNFCYECRIVPIPKPPDYADDWRYAGPLFDRYPGLVLMNNGNYYACTFGTQSIRGTTGPEAIAKAVKAWEESKR